MSVSPGLRMRVLQRDGFTCQYCGQKAPDVSLVVDHVVPVRGGGKDDPTNLVTSCWECNNGKRAREIYPPNWGWRDLRLAKRERQIFAPSPPKKVGLGLEAECVECPKRADTLHFLPWVVTEAHWIGPGEEPVARIISAAELEHMDLEDEDEREKWWEYEPISIVTACPKHDPGGYWLRLDDLNRNPDRWVNHLRQKRGNAHTDLVTWITDRLGHDANLTALYEDEPYKLKWEKPQ